jgi:periplasmic protein TonB
MSATAKELFSYVSQRGGVWLVIAAVHVATVYALVSWSPVRVLFEAAPIEASILDTPVPASEAPPPPVPQLVRAEMPVVEPPVIALNIEQPPDAITVVVAETPPAPAPSTPRVIAEVAYVEAPQPKYPAESRRSGEEGLVVLRVLINELGRAARIDIERSSGHARLDNAARLAVQRALFRPYVENGVPRMALAMIPIEFSWKSRRADKSGSRG